MDKDDVVLISTSHRLKYHIGGLMETIDHKNLGKYLLTSLQVRAKESHRKAFLLGCIIPDKIPFTYLKGSIKYKLFHGHDYENASNLIEKYIYKLTNKKGRWNNFDYFRFGILMHYVADAFTFPHNDEFVGGSREHIDYEAVLHNKISPELILTPQHTPLKVRLSAMKADNKGIFLFFQKLHDEYLEAKRSFNSDIAYIKETTLSVANAILNKELIPVRVKSSHQE